MEITTPVIQALQESRIADGLVTLFIRHTSASLVIQENADPEVRDDLERFFRGLVEDGDSSFIHRSEGPDDMPTHVRAALMATQNFFFGKQGQTGDRRMARNLPVGASLARVPTEVDPAKNARGRHAKPLSAPPA